MNKVDALVLSKVKGIGNKFQVALFDFCESNDINSLEELRTLDLNQIPALKRSVTKLASFFGNDEHLASREELQSLLNQWQNSNIEVITYGSPQYPTQLNELDDLSIFKEERSFCKK